MAVNFSQEQKLNIENNSKDKNDAKSIVKKIDDFLLKLSRVSLKERMFFVQHLGVMLKAGISLSVALKTLCKQTKNKYFIKILTDISDKVEKGTSFAESLTPHKKVFGEMFISMIEAGELSGKLEEVLQQVFLQMKKENQLMSKVKGALTYPIVILVVIGLIGVFMFVFIIPKMTGMFTEMGVELPLPTRILINISNAIMNNGVIAIIILVSLVIGTIKILQTEKGKYAFDAFLLNFPIVSPIIKKINLARFARNISSLLKTDIMIIKTFEITANVLGNVHYKKAILDMTQKIKKGGKLSEVINSYPKLFTPIVAQMVAIGEETGELDNILVELAEFYEEEVDQIMENLPTIIEPLLILVLGAGVGGIAVAIILPMYSIGNAI